MHALVVLLLQQQHVCAYDSCRLTGDEKVSLAPSARRAPQKFHQVEAAVTCSELLTQHQQLVATFSGTVLASGAVACSNVHSGMYAAGIHIVCSPAAAPLHNAYTFRATL